MKRISVSLQKWVEGTDCVLPKQIHYNANLFIVFDSGMKFTHNKQLLFVSFYLGGYSIRFFRIGVSNRKGKS